MVVEHKQLVLVRVQKNTQQLVVKIQGHLQDSFPFLQRVRSIYHGFCLENISSLTRGDMYCLHAANN
jgi:hypothetical protein